MNVHIAISPGIPKEAITPEYVETMITRDEQGNILWVQELVIRDDPATPGFPYKLYHYCEVSYAFHTERFYRLEWYSRKDPAGRGGMYEPLLQPHPGDKEVTDWSQRKLTVKMSPEEMQPYITSLHIPFIRKK